MLNYSALHVKFVASIFNYEQFAWEVVRRFFWYYILAPGVCVKNSGGMFCWKTPSSLAEVLPKVKPQAVTPHKPKNHFAGELLLDLRCFSGEPGHCPAHTYISWIFVIIMGDLVSEAS